MNARATSMRLYLAEEVALPHGHLRRDWPEAAQLGLESPLPSFRQVIESCACPVVIISSGAQTQPIVYASPAFLRLLGYGADQVLGQDWACFIECGDSRFGSNPFRAAIMSGSEMQGLLRAEHRDGSPLHLDARITPVRDESGFVTHHVAVLHDVSAEHQRRQELEYRAYHDPLTAVGNRSLLRERFDIALAHGSTFTLVLLDLDGFKQVNDRYGHDAGDSLLKSVAERLKELVRKDDTVVRLGGDEFALLLTDIESRDQGIDILHRIRESLARPHRVEVEQLPVTSSVGIARYPHDASSLDGLLKAADVRLYADKLTRKPEAFVRLDWLEVASAR